MKKDSCKWNVCNVYEGYWTTGDKQYMKAKNQTLLNLIASILAFCINAGIQFFVTPVLTRNIGDEAYGFITIANDFTSYASIFAVVLNSVAARFISVEFHKNNYEKATEYYNSIFVGNCVICIILFLTGGWIVMNFNKFLNISSDLVFDVRIVFAVTFVNYMLTVFLSIFSTSTFVKNRIDIEAVRNIISYAIKFAVVFVLFSNAYKVKAYYLGIATLISTLYLGIANYSITKKIMPEIKFDLRKYKFSSVVELLKSGLWMSINNLSNVFTNNFTSMFINLYQSSSAVGLYSVAKTIPNCVTSFMYAIYAVFVPTFVRLYAEKKQNELKEYAFKTMKIMSVLLTSPILLLIVFGKQFMMLWQGYRPMEEIDTITIIMALSVVLIMIISVVLPISQLSLTVNKLKWQMIANIIISLCTFGAVAVVLKAKQGLIGVSIVTTIIQSVLWIVFIPIYSAKVIDIKWYEFVVKDVIILAKIFVMGVCAYLIAGNIKTSSWFGLIIFLLIGAIILYVWSFYMFFNKDERQEVTHIIKKSIENVLGDKEDEFI